MIKVFPRMTLIRSTMTTVFALSLFGCASDMGSDSGASQMSAGLTQARKGLSKTQAGVDTFTAGSRQPGLTGMSEGMVMMDQGTTDVEKGMGMMSRNMMMNCADGGSDNIIQPMHAARDEIQNGQSVLGVDTATSDDEAIGHVQNGMTMMKTALDQAQTSMGCMGHGGMM